MLVRIKRFDYKKRRSEINNIYDYRYLCDVFINTQHVVCILPLNPDIDKNSYCCVEMSGGYSFITNKTLEELTSILG